MKNLESFFENNQLFRDSTKQLPLDIINNDNADPANDFFLNDRYGNVAKIYDSNKITNPTGFAMKQQHNLRCAEVYVDNLPKISLYNDKDRSVLEFVLKKHIYANALKLKPFLKDHGLFSEFPEISKTDVICQFSGISKNFESTPEKESQATISSYLQIWILGATLLRHSFEDIGVHYELETQVRLNKHIAQMYKTFSTFTDNMYPII